MKIPERVSLRDSIFMAKAIIFPAKGIGDALLMMIASQSLQQHGYHPIMCHPYLPQLQSWFPRHEISNLEKTAFCLDRADLILLENDNSSFSKELILQRSSGKLSQLSVLYPTYSAKKHGPLHPLDLAFDPTQSMADNIAQSMARLLSLPLSSKNNGLIPPPNLIHRKENRRVLIHPTSSDPKKNWTPQQFLLLGHKIHSLGYEVQFITSIQEHASWQTHLQARFPLVSFPCLSELAAWIYESGYLIGNDSLAGHLASNLNIPTLILADDAKRMRLWRPGWLKGEVLTPPLWLPGKIRKMRWQPWVPTYKALRSFHKLLRSA